MRNDCPSFLALLAANLILLLLGSALVLYGGEQVTQESSTNSANGKKLYSFGFEPIVKGSDCRSIKADRRAVEGVLRQLADKDGSIKMDAQRDRSRSENEALIAKARTNIKIIERWRDHGFAYSLAMLNTAALQDAGKDQKSFPEKNDREKVLDSAQADN